MEWQPGTRLNQQYRIDKKLGEGGFGLTYKATDLSLDHRVVIKTINHKLRSDREYDNHLKRFRQEARTLAKLGELRHHHIVRVSHLFEIPVKERSGWERLRGVEVPQLPCLVMDFIDGRNLDEWVKDKQAALSEEEALSYIQQVGDALHLVHRAGLVHRDVHPGNIMICNNIAILIDFGLAGSITPTSLNYGRPGHQFYTPIDQRYGNRSPNVDIYALGMSLYFAVTAKNPDPSKDPKSQNPNLSDRTSDAIVKAIQLESKNRPKSIPEWFDLLGLSLSPQALQPLPESLAPKPDKTPKTRRAFPEPTKPATDEAEAYLNRGTAKSDLGDIQGAIVFVTKLNKENRMENRPTVDEFLKRLPSDFDSQTTQTTKIKPVTETEPEIQTIAPTTTEIPGVIPGHSPRFGFLAGVLKTIAVSIVLTPLLAIPIVLVWVKSSIDPPVPLEISEYKDFNQTPFRVSYNPDLWQDETQPLDRFRDNIVTHLVHRGNQPIDLSIEHFEIVSLEFKPPKAAIEIEEETITFLNQSVNTVTYTVTDKDSDRSVQVQQITLPLDQNVYHLFYEAPPDLFSRYEDEALRVFSSFDRSPAPLSPTSP